MRRFSALVVILYVCVLNLGAQQKRHISADYDFVNYLVDRKAREDVCSLLCSTEYHPSDTLTFLRGWAAYNSQQLQKAAREFSQVGPESVFYSKSVYFGAVCSAYEGDYSAAATALDSYSGPRDELYYTELAGLSLLRQDREAYKSAASRFASGVSLLTPAQKALQRVYEQRYETRCKSPWVAGIASALLPGSGMWYAGDKVKGTLTFLSAVALGAIVAENNIHYGAGDIRSIVWDVAGAGFYVGNICSSVVTLRVQQQKIYDAQTSSVLYNIHIPLRSLFR